MRPYLVSKRRRGTEMVIGVLLVFALVFGSLGAAGEASAQDTAATTGIHKILFLGNSITLHGPAPSIG